MKNLSPYIIYISLSIFFAFTTSCHEKGCTNKNAINFNISADEDDGSCILCNSTEIVTGTKLCYLIDDDPASTHYNDTILKCFLTQKEITPSDEFCGRKSSVIYMTAQSLLNQPMYLRFRIFGNSTAYFSTSTTQIFESGQVFDIGMVYSNNNPPLVPIEWMGLLGYIESVTYF